MALFQLSFCCCVDIGFPLNNFCRDTLISLEICRKIIHCKIQIKFDIGNHLQNPGRVVALFYLVFRTNAVLFLSPFISNVWQFKQVTNLILGILIINLNHCFLFCSCYMILCGKEMICQLLKYLLLR